MSDDLKKDGLQTSEEKNIRYDNIIITPRGIAETCGKKVVIFIPAADVQRITLSYGRSDHRPIFSVSLGVIFTIVGVLGLIDFFLAMAGYRYEIGMMAFGVIGASLIYDALKQRYFLEVQSPKGPHRLVFSKHAQKDHIQTFCQSAETVYNYNITNTI